MDTAMNLLVLLKYEEFFNLPRYRLTVGFSSTLLCGMSDLVGA
jgi:hypothetical protein